jgi:hypothetical protein
MIKKTYGLTGLTHVQSISAVTHELTHLPGVTGVTLGVNRDGVSTIALTGTKLPGRKKLEKTVRQLGHQLHVLPTI